MKPLAVLRSEGMVWLLWLMIPAAGLAAEGAGAAAWARRNMEALGAFYRDLHSHPELSLQERRTAECLADQWRATGAEVTTGIGGHGVVGVLRNGDGPTLMLRCDMDALPVAEQTELVYGSKVKMVQEGSGKEVPVMHACGHDLHMTNMVGVAGYLAAHRQQWRGRVILVGQPAEERGGGARAMLQDGLYERFGKPDFGLALHVDPVRPVGQIGYRPGYTLASVDSVDIAVRGRGGHGAFPHVAIDPVVMAAELIMSLQTIVSREVKPIDAAVVTVGSIHAGTQHNVIPSECQLQLTVRSYAPEVRKQVLESIRRKAVAIAAGAGAPEPLIKIEAEGTPAVWNDPALTQRLVAVWRRTLGEERVKEAEPTMGGEDFSYYGAAGVPTVIIWLGSVGPDRLARFQQLGQFPPSLHSPLYYPDYEEALATGIDAMVVAAIELLPPGEVTEPKPGAADSGNS